METIGRCLPPESGKFCTLFSSDRKAQWHEVGAIWLHKSGKGFDLVIPTGLSVTGRIVCTERKEQQPAA